MAKFTYTVRCELEYDQQWDGDGEHPRPDWHAYTVIVERTCETCKDLDGEAQIDSLGMVWLPHDGDSKHLRATVRDMLGSPVQWRRLTFA